MKIDLSKLKKITEIIIDDNIEFEKDLYISSSVLNLKDFHFKGKVFYNNMNEVVLEGRLEGKMILPDSVTLEEISLPIKIDIEGFNVEITDYSQNTLDISLILWQNIVLEIPIRLTKNNSPKKTSGEGWSLKEEKEEYDPRLAPLRELLKEKE